MAVDDKDKPSRIADIIDRLGKNANYVARYRKRLIASVLVEAKGHGQLAYTLPYTKDYLDRMM